jgi:hypothetical protein
VVVVGVAFVVKAHERGGETGLVVVVNREVDQIGRG